MRSNNGSHASGLLSDETVRPAGNSVPLVRFLCCGAIRLSALVLLALHAGFMVFCVFKAQSVAA